MFSCLNHQVKSLLKGNIDVLREQDIRNHSGPLCVDLFCSATNNCPWHLWPSVIEKDFDNKCQLTQPGQKLYVLLHI